MGLRRFDVAPLVVMITAGCGRLDFGGHDAGATGDVVTSHDASLDGDLDAPKVVVAYTAQGESPFIISPTFGSGDLLVAAFSIDPGGAVISISDSPDGNMFVSAGVHSQSSDGVTEIWYAPDSHPGDTTVTITLNGSINASIWLVEFSGIATTAPLDMVAIDNAMVTANVSAPAVAVTLNELVVSVVNVNTADATSIATGNPFVALAPIEGDDAAYAVATGAGTEGAEWNIDASSDTATSTASFKPR